MARLTFSALADQDVATIITYLAREAGIVTAERYAAEFAALYDRLAEFPKMGSLRPAIGDDVRIAIVAPYIVIYAFDPVPDAVTVLRVLHGRRNITRKLLG